MDTEEEMGEKSGGKGVEYEADGENVNVAASTGGSDNLDGNRTQRKAVRCTDAIEGSHDPVTGQDLTETGWSAKNLDLGAMETTGNNTGTTAHYDGEPTESDVIYNLDGSVGFRDRSLGGEFVLVGGGRRKLEAPGNSMARTGNATATAAKADTDTAANKEHEANQKAIMDGVMREKARFEMEKRRLGLKPMISLAAQISKGEVGSSGIGKLSMLGTSKAMTKMAPNNKHGMKTIQTGATREATAVNNRQRASVHSNIGQAPVPSLATTLEAKAAQGTVAKATAAATVAVTRTMGAAKFAVAKATTVWTSRSTTTNMAKSMEESDTASGRETPRIQNSTSARQSNVYEMSRDTNWATATKVELESGATTTDSEFISMGLAGYGEQPAAMKDDEMAARKEWQAVEERALDQGAYRVRYEYSEKMDSAARSTSFELRALAILTTGTLKDPNHTLSQSVEFVIEPNANLHGRSWRAQSSF
jgi:hypothetical protein